MTIIVMGVSGCGKTTIGKMLAAEMRCEFCDADSLHPPANIAKMSAGIPLTDEDRAPWLDAVRAYILDRQAQNENAVVACSALREAYRQRLRFDETVTFVYLKGSYEIIYRRLLQRQGHFMKPELLKSQFAILEEPQDAYTLDVELAPEAIVTLIKERFVQ